MRQSYQHPHGRDEREDLHDPPEDERDAPERHGDGCRIPGNVEEGVRGWLGLRLRFAFEVAGGKLQARRELADAGWPRDDLGNVRGEGRRYTTDRNVEPDRLYCCS
jgi:hypothetical protein